MWPAIAAPSDERAPVRWSTGAKDGVGTAIGARSRLWFTLAGGIVTEVFYPSVDCANTRSLRTVLALDHGVFVDGSDCDATVSTPSPHIPAYDVVTRKADFDLVLCKTIIADPSRSVLLQRVRLERNDHHRGARAFVILEPHLGNNGASNDAWLGEYKGQQALMARHGDVALALLCSRSFTAGTCTYAGQRGALEDLRTNGAITRIAATATDGNLQLAAEIDLGDGSEWILALGFGQSSDHAAQQARASLLGRFDRALRRYTQGWSRYCQRYVEQLDDSEPAVATVHGASVAMLRAHEDKERAGAIIASVAIPWGNAHGDQTAGGYHLVWPRDLVEAAGAFLAVGNASIARRTLSYLMSTQEADGMWPQNMWLDGTPDLNGVQLDEVALPILLANLLSHNEALAELDPWPMIRAAAGYLVRHGPCTPEDRWEEEAGYSPYTIAAEIAALLAAARFAERAREPQLAHYLCETADYWNASIERWMYVDGTPTAEQHDVDGYYVRLVPPAAMNGHFHPRPGTPLVIHNHPCENARRPYEQIVSPDALALVRFGLRRADDPRIRNTIAVIDAELETQTARGPVWHRYTDDGYGERADGEPHLGWGKGRGWPLLVGERAHYEIANGDLDRARQLRRAMATQAGQTGLLPEQVWDAPDIPERGLFNGRPTGSAMPLVWAHAEFLKLSRSLRDGRVFDLPVEAAERYRQKKPSSPLVVWRAAQRISEVPSGLTLRVEASGARHVAWRLVGSERHGCVEAHDVGVGLAFADLPTSELPQGAVLFFRVEGGDKPGREQRVTFR